MFNISSLPADLREKMMQTKVWQVDCIIALDDLSLIELEHYNFNQEVKTGQLVAANLIAYQTINIFKELFKLKFPINKIVPIDHYSGNDEKSMEDNNSSCFNFRKIVGSNNLSKHSYGLAIDINPLQNPFIQINMQTKHVQVKPSAGVDYLNRRNQRPGMVEDIFEIFAAYDFKIWGGLWNTPIDYHHFQVDDEFLKKNNLI